MSDISIDFNIKGGDKIVVSLLFSCYDFIIEALKNKGILNDDFNLVDVSIIRKCGQNTISVEYLDKIVERIASELSSYTNTILFYYCDSTEEIPHQRNNRTDSCQEYRNKLFNILFDRYNRRNNNKWNDYEIIFHDKEIPQYMHLIYPSQYKSVIEQVAQEFLESVDEVLQHK